MCLTFSSFDSFIAFHINKQTKKIFIIFRHIPTICDDSSYFSIRKFEDPHLENSPVVNVSYLKIKF